MLELKCSERGDVDHLVACLVDEVLVISPVLDGVPITSVLTHHERPVLAQEVVKEHLGVQFEHACVRFPLNRLTQVKLIDE